MTKNKESNKTISQLTWSWIKRHQKRIQKIFLDMRPGGTKIFFFTLNKNFNKKYFLLRKIIYKVVGEIKNQNSYNYLMKHINNS